MFSATKGKSLSKDKISNDGKYECILYGEIYTTYAEKIESIVSRTNYYEGILSQKNDLIFPNSTTTNAWDLATFSSLQKNNVLIGGDISILRTKRSDISSLFYAYYLTNYLKLRKDIAKYAQGITIVHLSFNNFYKIKVQIPSLEEQNSITDFIDSLNQQQKLITNKIKLLKERKKGFLQKMFV
ncbi:restriction endonuclease subunit S [Mammaliicoccus sciuri]